MNQILKDSKSYWARQEKEAGQSHMQKWSVWKKDAGAFDLSSAKEAGATKAENCAE